MKSKKTTKEQLTELLRQAEKAHGKYEKSLGHRDENWSEWYASFILRELESKGEN